MLLRQTVLIVQLLPCFLIILSMEWEMSNVLSFIVEFYFEHQDTFGKTIVVS